MKRVLFIVAIISFGIFGCSENTSLTGPENIDAQNSFLKVATNNSSMLMKTSVSKDIDGDRGGLVRINLESADEEFGARGWLYFAKDSFEGTENISVSIADGIAALDFEPSGIPLVLPAHLTLMFNGVELNKTDKIDFKYIDADGNLSPVTYKRLIINKRKQQIIVIDAELNHFSRYGFTK